MVKFRLKRKVKYQTSVYIVTPFGLKKVICQYIHIVAWEAYELLIREVGS